MMRGLPADYTARVTSGQQHAGKRCPLPPNGNKDHKQRGQVISEKRGQEGSRRTGKERNRRREDEGGERTATVEEEERKRRREEWKRMGVEKGEKFMKKHGRAEKQEMREEGKK